MKRRSKVELFSIVLGKNQFYYTKKICVDGLLVVFLWFPFFTAECLFLFLLVKLAPESRKNVDKEPVG